MFLFRDPQASIRSWSKVLKVLMDDSHFANFWGNALPLPDWLAPEDYRAAILSGAMTRERATPLLVMASLRAARDFVAQGGHFAEIFAYEELLEDGPRVDKLLALFHDQDQPKFVLDSSIRQVICQSPVQ